MLGDFLSGHQINPERFLECPWQNPPARRTTYGARQSTQKILECAEKSTCRAPPNKWVCGLGAVVRHLHRPSPIEGGCHRCGYSPAAPRTSGSGFLR